VYVPPFKMAQRKITDKSSEEYQRVTWMALRKGINGLVNKVNVANIKDILPDLFELNLIRGRGLFARALTKAQLISPGFTHIYAALVAVVNTKLPENGELILKRCVASFQRALRRLDKVIAIASLTFIAHLVNQNVANEILALEVILRLLTKPTSDSVEMAVEFTKEVGAALDELAPSGLRDVFEAFRGILQQGQGIDKRVQYMIEGLFAVRKTQFADHPSIMPGLDLVESDEQITHEIHLTEEKIDKEEILDVFRKDERFLENEELWKQIRKEVLGEEDSSSSSSSDDEDGSGSGSDADSESGSGSSSSDEDGGGGEGGAGGGGGGATSGATVGPISDRTEADLVNLRRTIYLTIMSSAGFEECVHKLMKVKLMPGEETELCKMLIECCSQERTFSQFYGLVGQRFCLIAR
jgi:pre-mRNA-splicing factor CWC22